MLFGMYGPDGPLSYADRERMATRNRRAAGISPRVNRLRPARRRDRARGAPQAISTERWLATIFS